MNFRFLLIIATFVVIVAVSQRTLRGWCQAGSHWAQVQLNPVDVFYDPMDGLGPELSGSYQENSHRQLYEYNNEGKLLVKGTPYSPRELEELVEAGNARVTWLPLPYEGNISLVRGDE